MTRGAGARPARVAVAVVASLASAACVAPAWRNVDPARDTVALFRQDQYECREQNRYRTAQRRWGEERLSPYTVVDEDAAAECLTSKGWRPRP